MILSNNGKQWSETSREVENMFGRWTEASGINKEDLIKMIDDTFEISICNENNMTAVTLKNEEGDIGLPFIWYRDGDIPYTGFKLDLSLVLTYIRTMEINKTARQKIKDFIIENKLNR